MVMDETTAIERVLRRDRLIVLGGLLAIIILAWIFVLEGAGTGMSVGAMTTWRFPPPVVPLANEPWPAQYWLIMLLMWWAMMVAMMTPSAAPMILLYARVARRAQKQGQMPQAVVPTAWFVLGYLTSWLAFSTVAVAVQWTLERIGLMHMMMMWSLDKWLSGALLMAAGLYQLSPLKDICLLACRSPVEFLSRHWRQGPTGALHLGLAHGLYCIGCCWALMALLFVGGIMNLVWIVGLTTVVLVEKIAPYGHQVARVTGTVLVATAIYVIAG
jgi:predicted metal-binding membrane protein